MSELYKWSPALHFSVGAVWSSIAEMQEKLHSNKQDSNRDQRPHKVDEKDDAKEEFEDEASQVVDDDASEI